MAQCIRPEKSALFPVSKIPSRTHFRDVVYTVLLPKAKFTQFKRHCKLVK